MTPRRVLTWLAMWVLAGVFLAGCFTFVEDVTPPPGWEPSPIPPTPVWEDFLPSYPLDPNQGASIYAQSCASCHGPQGLGDGELTNQLTIPPAAIGTRETQQEASALEWFQVVTEGRLERQMPPFGRSLSDRQRWNVLAYLFTLALTPQEREAARQRYQVSCQSCHGPQARGDGPQAPDNTPDLTDPARWATVSPEAWAQAILDPKGGVHDVNPPLSGQEALTLAFYVRELAMTAGAEATPTPTTAPSPTPTAQPAGGEAEATPTSPTPAAGTPTPQAQAEATREGIVTITIRGQIKHAEGNPLPPDMSVRLQAFDQNGMPLEALETTVDPDGTFVFANVQAAFHTMFLVATEYEGVMYISDSIVAVPEQQEYEVTLEVYDTTTSLDAVRIQRLHLLVEAPEGDQVRVAELYIIENTGVRTVVAEDPAQGVLKFTLPEGATGLSFPPTLGQLGDRFRLTEGGFVDTEPLRPGRTSLLFSYVLPYDRNWATIAHTVPLPVQAVTLLTPPGMKVQEDNWQSQGTRTVQTDDGTTLTLQVFAGPSLQAGETLRVTVSGRPPTATTPQGMALPRLSLGQVLIAVGVALIVGSLGYYWYSRRAGPPRLEEPIPPALAEDPEALMDAILALDAMYEAGELDEATYQRRRTAYKTYLQWLLKRK